MGASPTGLTVSPPMTMPTSVHATRSLAQKVSLLVQKMAAHGSLLLARVDPRMAKDPGHRYSGFAPKASRRPSQSFTTNSRERQDVSASARVNSTPRLAYSAYSASASSMNR
jgi:hypothetical protein